MIEKSPLILAQLNSNSKNDNHYHCLILPLALDRKSQKPQISTTPGISQKERDRYRLVLGDRILGDFLSIEEALALAKPFNSKSNNPSHS
jgi:hypothetical protein